MGFFSYLCIVFRRQAVFDLLIQTELTTEMKLFGDSGIDT